VALAKLEAAKGVAPATKAWAEAITAYLKGSQPSPVPDDGKVWADTEAVLDQGDYGTCVGNGFAQWGNTLPVDDKYTEKAARAIYYEATVLDGSPDDPDAPGGGQQGATVRSGAKAMVARKRIGTYAFAKSTDEITAWVSAKGPVVVGTNWTEDMFTPDVNGIVYPTGGVAGGHCYVLVGYHPGTHEYEFLNSWGESFGLHGRFFMAVEDFGLLLAQDGEAVAAVELP